MKTHAASAVGAAGLIALVVGTFLPWLRSGESQRNVYRAGGALRRLLHVHGVAAFGLDVLPFLGLWCAAVAVAYAFGYRRTGCVGALLVAAVGLSVAVGALTADGNGFVTAQPTGPIVTIVGSALLVSAVTVLLLPGRAGLPEQERA